VHVRLTGLNSSTVADAVREGRLEAGLIVLPIDDRGLEVQTLVRDEIVFMSADPARLARPMTIERLVEAPLILYDARYGADDPTRRQLLERAQEAGVKLQPDIEVEYVEAALELAARGLGDTLAANAIGLGRGFARRLGTVSFDPPLYDTFAFIHRRNAHLSPATRAFMALAEKRIVGLVNRLREARD
jgi:DNA-binding transcriptional LysR family regulator